MKRECHYVQMQLDPPPRTMTLYFCGDCSAAVASTEDHDNWHTKVHTATLGFGPIMGHL